MVVLITDVLCSIVVCIVELVFGWADEVDETIGVVVTATDVVIGAVDENVLNSIEIEEEVEAGGGESGAAKMSFCAPVIKLADHFSLFFSQDLPFCQPHFMLYPGATGNFVTILFPSFSGSLVSITACILGPCRTHDSMPTFALLRGRI